MIRKLLKWSGIAFLGFVALGVIVSAARSGNVDSSDSEVSVSTTAPAIVATTPAAHQKHQQPRPDACAHITRSPRTSCPFALAVIRAYKARPSADVTAYSPVTHLTYTLRCIEAQGVVSCAGGHDSALAFAGPPIPGNTAPPAAPGTTQTTPATPPAPPAAPVEGPGSYDHATDAQFCGDHQCIPNFPNGSGYIVQCADGGWSHSGGRSGACSDHGGEG